VEVEYLLADEEHAVAHVHVRLSGGLQARISEHWTIRDGRVVELRPFYWDPGAITAARGMTQMVRRPRPTGMAGRA
jgi:ketosteroid isomerase-like protein